MQQEKVASKNFTSSTISVSKLREFAVNEELPALLGGLSAVRY